MSCNYAESLSHYENKGKLGLPEIFDSVDELEIKCRKLAELIKSSSHTVVHTGAGVSTSAGIPDFRGPNGVWTLEKKGEKPSINVSWDDAKPTKTHMALLALQKAGYVSYIITQNIDGLHLRSGFPRRCLSELHGNLYTDQCAKCQRQYVRQEAAATVGLKSQGVTCAGRKANGRRCRGKLQDTILDWEDSLPDADLELADMHSRAADLSLCLGTTLQIVPSGNLPVHTKKRGGKLVICNLQPTKQDKHADLLIHYYVDDILIRVMDILEIPIPKYDFDHDPIFITRKILSNFGYPLCASKDASSIPELPEEFHPIDWSIPGKWVKDKELIQKSKSRKVIKTKRKSSTENNDNKRLKQDIKITAVQHENERQDIKDQIHTEEPDIKGKTEDDKDELQTDVKRDLERQSILKTEDKNKLLDTKDTLDFNSTQKHFSNNTNSTKSNNQYSDLF